MKRPTPNHSGENNRELHGTIVIASERARRSCHEFQLLLPSPPPSPPIFTFLEKATREGHRGRRRGSGQGTEVWGPAPTCGDGPKYLGPTAERERNPTPQPGGGRKRSRGEGESSGGREVAGQAARPAAADPWSVNKPSGPTLPQPRACPLIGKAQDGSAAGPDLAASLLLACDASPGVAGGRPGRPSGLGAIRERGARAGRGGAARGLQRGALPGPSYLAAAVALPPAPAPPPSPTLGARRPRRRRRLPEQPAATSRARPRSASLRTAARPAAAASALSPKSGHGHRGPARDSRCRRRGQRGGEQARRRGDAGGRGERGEGGGLGRSGLLMAAVRGPGAKKKPHGKQHNVKAGPRRSSPCHWPRGRQRRSQWSAASFRAQEAGRGKGTSRRRRAPIVRRRRAPAPGSRPLCGGRLAGAAELRRRAGHAGRRRRGVCGARGRSRGGSEGVLAAAQLLVPDLCCSYSGLLSQPPSLTK